MSLNFGKIVPQTTQLESYKAWMSLNFGKIVPQTTQLSALEHLEKMPTPFLLIAIDIILSSHINRITNIIYTVGNHVTSDVMLNNPIMGAAILIFCKPNDGFSLLMR